MTGGVNVTTALVIIDVQNFYFGDNGLEGSVEASLVTKNLLNRFRELGLPVIHVQHVGKTGQISPDKAHAYQIHDNVRPLDSELVIAKRTPGAFNGTELLTKLQTLGVDTLVICGMMSHMCVDTTTREAFDLGFKCTVVHDACATRALKFEGIDVPAAMVHSTAMAALSYAFAEVISCEELLELGNTKG